MRWSRVRIPKRTKVSSGPVLYTKKVVIIAAKDKDFEISQHILVPKHSKLNDKEKTELLEKYKITFKDLPKISMKDPAISHLDLTNEDIVKIERASPTSKRTIFYRRVVK